MKTRLTIHRSASRTCEMTEPVSGRKPILALLMRLLWAAVLAPLVFGAQASVLFTSLHSFQGFPNGASGANPSGLVQGSDGYFYGTTSSGGTANFNAGLGTYGYGTVFKINTNGALTHLYSFTGPKDGAYPNGLVQGRDGNFYGTTGQGGTNNLGTVFKISTNGALTSLYSFTGTNDGAYPNGLAQGSDGYFYGTTPFNGETPDQGFYVGDGAVFRISTNGALTTLHSFTGGNDGGNPFAGLVQGSDGNFYGTTISGGNTNLDGGYGDGTVFKISTNGALTTLYAFGMVTNSDGDPLDGAQPYGRLVQGSDGNFYGTTSYGGTNWSSFGGWGTVFKISADGALTSLYWFTGGTDGGNPEAPLVQGSDGNFYGTTSPGGRNGGGTVFQMSTNAAPTTLHSFSGGNDGANPEGLVQGSDGSFYGTTSGGGAGGAGTVFRLTVDSARATHYVWQSSPTPTPPYTTWGTAATNIQDAVDTAGAGDEIVVTNGTYAPVAVDRPVRVRSANGPDVTLVSGSGDAQCVYLANAAALVGFTLTNGMADNGGGVYCESTTAWLSNCVLTGNSAYWDGGGAYGGTLSHCTVTGNNAYGEWSQNLQHGGGDGAGAYGSTLNYCTLSGNSAYSGGGADSSALNNCTLTGNSAEHGGGGVDNCTLSACTLSGNAAYGYNAWLFGYIPGSGGGADSSTLNNCTVTGNSAGSGGGACSCTLNNCTVTANSGWGAMSATLNNCIVYFNSDTNGGNYDPSSTLNYCCTTPMPPNGVGNISADPQLASASHLSAESPCIGAGSATYASGTDIDGEPWANPPSIGCDEYHAGAVTGPLTVSLTATLTNVAIGFPVGLTAFIEGRTDLSVWDFGDGFVEVNEPHTSHTWTALGDYLVALWAFNESFPGGVSATVTVHVDAGVHYVAASNGNPVAPYTSWATAATNIQDAVDAAGVGGTIFVTNGFYAAGGRTTPLLGDGTTNRVAVDKPLTVRSVNGPELTVIQGRMPGATNAFLRCVYLANAATLVGFTLTNGVADLGAGGVYCASASVVLSNCVLSGNSGSAGGGAYGGTLNDCTFSGNSAGNVGGGASDSILNNCTLTGNLASEGGGAYGCTLNNCTLSGNSAPLNWWGAGNGGGTIESTLNNCTLSGNSAGNVGGGACGSILNNCTLTGNTATGYHYEGTFYPGDGGACYSCTLNNCILTGNSASSGGGADGGTLNNCIVYYNSASDDGPNYGTNYGTTLNYCCTTPLPDGIGNITNAPMFVDQMNGNLRLQSNSPCINAGDNAYVVGSTDLSGNPRIVGGTVDIGAYEYQTPTSIISYPWLQQYGLPIDGSADFTDPDRDGMNNWQEWIAGTNPTNALSVLKVLVPASTKNPAGLVVTWESVNTRTYYLESSTNLAAEPAFSVIQRNIVGQAGTTSFTDATATNAGPYFYRVGIGN